MDSKTVTFQVWSGEAVDRLSLKKWKVKKRLQKIVNQSLTQVTVHVNCALCKRLIENRIFNETTIF